MNISIHWFRQDLRLDDNPALFEAVKSGKILPIYILDDKNACQYKMGSASRIWLHHSLLELNKFLDGKLLLFSGDAFEIIKKITDTHPISAIYWNRCYEPWRIKRDKKIKDYLTKKGIPAFSYNGSVLWEPWEILKEDKSPYKIFTSFYKKACLKEDCIKKPICKPQKIEYAKIVIESNSIESLNLLPNLIWNKSIIKNWQIGETGANKSLNNFLKNGINDYQDGRNFPAKQNVSRLSPHLHFGEISPRKIWHSVKSIEKNLNSETFLSEIGWREFSYNLLYHFPELPRKNLQEKFNAFPWLKNDEKLKLWQKGMTGYPIVDAGMRELWQTGYMHNRVRMIVGSFLVKNLLLHWNFGERWFWDCLFDADLASNSASWQWVAGCGTDASPYFRIFNPITQGRKFDPNGEYTKFYVPELSNIPDEYLFNPWEAPEDVLIKSNVNLGETYPYPIIDLKFSREQAISGYQSIKTK
jgi:deoxyribodipyrimidine photo-lyase